jgi:hypothetical protein
LSGGTVGLVFASIQHHLHRMQLLARLLLLIAAFAYGTMPMTGMSVMAMPVAHAMDASDPHGTVSAPTIQAMVDVDCPHSVSRMTVADGGDASEHSSKPMKISWHCSACLTLPALPVVADSGKPARAAEAATLAPRLVSQLMAPQTPPPRA